MASPEAHGEVVQQKRNGRFPFGFNFSKPGFSHKIVAAAFKILARSHEVAFLILPSRHVNFLFSVAAPGLDARHGDANIIINVRMRAGRPGMNNHEEAVKDFITAHCVTFMTEPKVFWSTERAGAGTQKWENE
ncbi:hypothetical protein DMN91_009025 [Ooceraea biroi]|uniref:Uncharacterized protein n=1 Tax=Ooceraea biroi TaxID=2015173 RepID=A0A3L8DFJ7_OOCBI|nr:hypothetical protein DMN91_009025 [Ooceraea biroi]